MQLINLMSGMVFKMNGLRLNKNSTVILITGTHQGLGFFIKKIFSIEGYNVVSINRKLYYEGDIVVDLSERINDAELIIKHVAEYQKIIFINNASTIEPVKKVGSLESESIRKSMNLNLYNPVLLINEIIRS